MAAETSPLKKLIDPKTGQVRRFATLREEMAGEAMPGLLRYGLLACNTVLLTTLVSVPVVAVGAALMAAVYFVERQKEAKRYASAMEDGGVMWSDVLRTYDLTQPQDQQRFRDHFPNAPARFITDFLKITENAGLPYQPRCAVLQPRADKSPPTTVRGTGLNAAALDNIHGTQGAVMIGDEILHTFKAPHLNAVIAHEVTHLALRHVDRKYFARSMDFLNILSGVFLAAAAFATASVLTVPAIMLTLAAIPVNAFSGALLSRHFERMCDRGSALLTGNPQALATALQAVRTKTEEMESRAFIRGILTGEKAPLPTKEKQQNIFERMLALHPPTSTRTRLLEQLESRAGTAFWQQRRANFARTFNKAAVNHPRQPLIQKVVNRAQQGIAQTIKSGTGAAAQVFKLLQH